MSPIPPVRDRFARLLLFAYPRRFRRRFGAELWLMHRRLHADAGRGERLGRWRLYAAFALDCLSSGLPARLCEAPNPAALRARSTTGSPLMSRLLDVLRLDLRLAVRSLARRPGFSAVAVFTLALGLGSAMTLFHLLDSTLLRPLGYEEPERLVKLFGYADGLDDPRGTIAYLDFVDWVERTEVFDSAAAYDEWTPSLTSGGRPVRLAGALVNASFFEVLGVEPAAGRFFAAEEDDDGRDAVVVLSHGLWQRRFGGDPATVGRSVELDGRPHQVVGVAPAGFEDPHLSGGVFGLPEIWRPLGYGGLPLELQPDRSSSSYTAIARLAPGVSRRQAEERLAAVVDDLAREYPRSNDGRRLRLVPLEEHLVGGVRGTLGLMLAAVGLLLLTAAANVAGLLLGRVAERRRESAVRCAVGAGRGRVASTLLTETFVLTGLGGAAGAGLALWAIRLLAVYGGDLLPRELPPVPSAVALLVAVALTFVTGLAVGLVPALLAARTDLRSPLRESTGGGRRASRLRHGMVVAEVAVSITLLVGAGLLLRSYWSLAHVDPGIDTADLLTFNLTLPSSDYPDDAAVDAFYDALVERLRALPAVESVATASMVPLSGSWDCNLAFAAERPEPPLPEQLCVETRTVTPSYFETLGLRRVGGRLLDGRDRAGAPPAAVVTEALARELWPGQDAVGRRLRVFSSEVEVVGVVADVKHLALGQPAPAQLFMTRGQRLAAWQGRRATVVVRTAAAPFDLAPAARRAVWSLDGSLPVAGETTMERVVAGTLSADRWRTSVLAAFALVATLMSALGLYGVLAYQVVQRRFEMAIRLALGARRQGVVRLVVGEGLALVLAGAALGLAAAAALSGLLARFLYQVAPGDPVSFAAVAALMVAVGTAASWLPARRAAGVDPARALRGGAG